MVDLGWASMGLLELTALPTLDRDLWVPRVLEADALVVAGGDVLYLAHWMRESSLLDLLPQLDATVWVGLSSGSMVMAPEVGEEFIQWRPPSGATETLGLVDFALFPHLAPDGEPGNSLAEAEEWFGRVSPPAYVLDDRSAVVVADGETRVVSEGTWHLWEH